MSHVKSTPFGTFRVFDYDAISKDIETSFWEAHCRKYFDAVKAGSGFVDIGANFGFYSIYMGLRGCPTWAFEPAKQIFELLKENVTLNGLDDLVKPFEVALWDGVAESLAVSEDWLTDAASLLFLDPDGAVNYDRMANSGGMSFMVSDKPAPSDKKERLFKPKKLDDYRLWESGIKIGLIKVDTQGGDLRVLKGARETIARERPALLFEYEPQPAQYLGDSLQSCFDFLEEINYTPEILYSVGEEWRQFGAIPK